MAKKSKEPASIEKQSLFSGGSLFPVLACILYFAVHFVPEMDAYDNMGSQWIYMVAVDFAVTVFILSRKNDYRVAASTILGNIFSKLYLAFFALAGLSLITAVNPTEGWVCYVRFIATIVAFFNISILLYNRTDLFKIIAQVLGVILLIECLQAIAVFLNGFETMELTDLIKQLKGTAGNKNIFSAGLVMKVPFVIYCIHRFRIWGKLLNMLILLLAAFTIFIANARAAYLSFLFILVLYIVYCILEYRKDKKTEQALFRIGYIVIPLLAAFFISQIELNTVKSIQNDNNNQPQLFGSVTERLSTLGSTTDENNQVRLRLWAHAIDYTKHHPLIGCGYGNWKIASIPYQRIITKDLYVPIHAHNDFVETFAELGVTGGLLYLSLFICLIVFTYKTYCSNADEETKLISLISFLAFMGYSIDAFFNFPVERPVCQMFFAFISAVNLVAYLKGRNEIAEDDSPVAVVTGSAKSIFCLLALLFLMPAFYVTYLTYQSLKVQRYLLADLDNEPLKLDWKTILSSLPDIPNLSATAQPIDAIKGRYLSEVGKFEESLVYMDKGRKANPAIGYSEFLKATVYFKQEKYDSARRNAITAFYMRPKAKTYYQTLIAVLAKIKDTANIKKAFDEYIRYRPEQFGWDLYLRGLLNSTGHGTPALLAIADSSLAHFPKDSTLLVRRAEILGTMSQQTTSAVNNAKAIEDVKLANKYYQDGIAAFGSGNPEKDDLEKAAGLFLKAAKLSPNNYIIYENAAMCYFNKKDFAKSLLYFDKVLAMTNAGNGKSEFFKGVALLSLGRKEGCTYLVMAQKKNYKEKEADLKAILKSHCGL
jgi:O-antigen ligase/tetratricopeptide (TPR) repeat protein